LKNRHQILSRQKDLRCRNRRRAENTGLEDGSRISAEEILVGAGRSADLSALGLEKLGLAWDRERP